MSKPHSIKVPTQYKATAKILKVALEKKQSVRQLLFQEKHARLGSLQAVLNHYSNNCGAIDNAIEQTGILKDNPRLDPELCKVLISELIYGRGQLKGESRPVQTVLEYKTRLEEVLGVVSGSQFQKKVGTKNPRYVRVNTNLLSMAEALEYLAAQQWRRKELQASETSYEDFLIAVRALEEDEFMLDLHVETLLIFHPTQAQYWAQHEFVENKQLLLQTKGTCLAAELLAPPTGATVLDLCAAPGIKTLHLSNVMQNKGRIYSVEMNTERYMMLLKNVELGGCSIVQASNVDAFTRNNDNCPDVEYVLVDPSCSGSGTKRLTFEQEQKDDKRLRKLAGLQIKMLSHAMTAFPNVKRLVYCTCSLWKEENEQVVERVLQLNPNFKLLSGKKALRNKWTNFGSSDYKTIGKNCLYALPDHDLSDGIFLALFERRRDNETD